MEAAVCSRARFHVVSFEKSEVTGRKRHPGSKRPAGMVQEFVDTQMADAEEYGVSILKLSDRRAIRYSIRYCVVVACGGEQIIPRVPGFEKESVYYIEDVLQKKVSFEGKKIAVIGGGHVGLEVAHFLCADNKVTVVEMQKEVGVTIYRTAKYKLLSLLDEAGVELLTEHALAAVTDTGVTVKNMKTQENVELEADVVIMALGNRPNTTYVEKLRDSFGKVVVIGDADKSGTMADATKAAYEMCFYI